MSYLFYFLITHSLNHLELSISSQVPFMAMDLYIDVFLEMDLYHIFRAPLSLLRLDTEMHR